MFQKARVLVSVAAITALAACGGQGNPVAPRQPAFSQTLTGTIAAFDWIPRSLTVPRSGELTLTLTWEGEDDLDLYLTETSCVDLYPLEDCAIVEVSDGIRQDPEIVTRRVRAGEQFTI